MRFLLSICLILMPAMAIGQNIEHQGIKRWFHVFDAGIADQENAPMIVSLHGYMSKDSALAARTNPAYVSWPELERLARIHNFRILYPLAFEGRWSLFPGIKGAVLEDRTPIDDVGFVLKLVQTMIEDGIADPNRIYLQGLSDGAIMTFRLLCIADSPFAAGAPVIGFMREEHLEDCSQDLPPPILVIAGTLDRILPYDGWLYTTGRYISVPETMEFWRKRYGCTEQTSTTLKDIAPDDQSTVTRVDWTGCSREGAIRLYRVEGGGHQAPSFSPPASEWAKTRAGPRNRDIETANHVWSFFQEFHQAN
ncbi:MAG: hypothetical protein AAGE80_14400 [Pseudomonadota bacterium]